MKYIQVIVLTLFIVGLVKVEGQNTPHKPIEDYMRYSKEKKFNKWDIMIGYGPNIVKDDFSEYLIFPKSNWHFSPSASINYQLVPALSFGIRGMIGDLHSETENHYYDGDFFQITGNARFYINQMLSFPGPINDKWNFYCKLGFGYHAFRNKVYDAHTNELLQVEALGEDYFVLGYDQENPAIKTARQLELVLPVGAGVLYRLNRSFDVGIESTVNYGLEDNLDGILLGASNDNYWYTSFNLSYKFGKKDKRHSKWTYRSYNFNMFGKKKKDPLEDEINQYERFLTQQEGILRLQIDSVITEESDTIIYTADDIFPIYFMPGGETFKDYENQVTIAQISMLLKKYPTWTINIIGHADESDNKPELISQKRAEAVKYYFMEHYGIDEKIITIFANGTKDQLMHQNSDNNPDKINIDKRVDIEIIRPRPKEIDTKFFIE